FWDFLTTKNGAFTSKEEKALWTLVEGADRFVTRLSELATALPEEEKPSCGSSGRSPGNDFGLTLFRSESNGVEFTRVWKRNLKVAAWRRQQSPIFKA